MGLGAVTTLLAEPRFSPAAGHHWYQVPRWPLRLSPNCSLKVLWRLDRLDRVFAFGALPETPGISLTPPVGLKPTT